MAEILQQSQFTQACRDFRRNQSTSQETFQANIGQFLPTRIAPAIN